MLLNGAVERFTGEDSPRGCLLASSAATGSAAVADIHDLLTSIRMTIEDLLRARIERDIADGVLPEATDAGALAATVICTIQGMSVLARDGASREKLAGIADGVVRLLPN